MRICPTSPSLGARQFLPQPTSSNQISLPHFLVIPKPLKILKFPFHRFTIKLHRRRSLRFLAMAASSPSTYALPLHRLSIGDSILVYWNGDRTLYPADITEAKGDHDCEVLYKDGEREWIRLDKVRFILSRRWDWGPSTRGKGKKAKSDAEKEKEEESAGIEKIRDVLFDIEDRLPLEAVCTKSLEWWKTWRDDIMMVVVKNDIRGLMDATLSLALQLKPRVTTKWWAKHHYLFPGQEPPLSSKEAIFSSLVSTSGKLQLLAKLLPRLKEKGNRVLLFSQMTKMLDILEDFLMYLGISYFRIDGSTPIAARQQQMKVFNDPKSEVFVFLISTRAGVLGIDLSRAHRIGQTRPVVVYQLITKCSVEVKILHKSKEKLVIGNLVMNPSKKPNVNELHSILLHGASTILNRKNMKATSIHYDDKAIDTLLKLDPLPGENYTQYNNGYLGSIQSFATGDDENTGAPASPKAEEWENILGPVEDDAKNGNLGRGKRQKKTVNYECDESDSDEMYSPEVSSSSDDSSVDSETAAGYDGMRS